MGTLVTTPKVSLVKTPRRHRKVTMPLWWLVVIPVLCLTTIVAANFAYTRHVDNNRAASVARIIAQRDAAERENDRRWCSLLNLILRSATQSPPTTDFGREYVELISRLRDSFGCAGR